MKTITIKVPKGWRKGQTISNLESYLGTLSGIDSFYISDKDFNTLLKSFQKYYSSKKK